MARDRHRLLLALVGVTTVLTAVLLAEVLPTVFFALTVAYLLVPLQDWFRSQGLSRRWATASTTVVATIGALVPLTTMGYILYARRVAIIDAIASIPAEIAIEMGGLQYVITTARVLAALETALADAAVPLATAVPVIALKLGLFALLVYGLLVRYEAGGAALLAAIPTTYEDIVWALHDRTRETLFAIYVIQVATALVTGVFAYVVFVGFGYEYAATLGILAGILQFLPIVGPSVVVLVLAVWELGQGQAPAAVLITVVGLIVIAGLPDLLVRPWLARGTADLPGSLYFVGFVGGILTVGVVGVIAGPLVVALLAEAIHLLGEDVQHGDRPPGA